MNELEAVFAAGHEYAERIFYDYAEGKYYDRGRDLYLEYSELKQFGIPC